MGHIGGPLGRTIFIRGRYKTMILTANGQNIYPEEIEAKLNNMPYVSESLIVDRGGKLVALINPDDDDVRAAKLTDSDLRAAMGQNLRELNKLVAPYEQVADFEIMAEEFVKTPKRSIKRFMYK